MLGRSGQMPDGVLKNFLKINTFLYKKKIII